MPGGTASQPVSQSASGRWCSRDSQSERAGHTRSPNLLTRELNKQFQNIYKYIHILIPAKHSRTPEHCVCWRSEEIPDISGQILWVKSWLRRRDFLCCEALNSLSPQQPAAHFGWRQNNQCITSSPGTFPPQVGGIISFLTNHNRIVAFSYTTTAPPPSTWTKEMVQCRDSVY